MIGDAIPGGNTDVLYTGETGESAWTLQYYRNKANEFQSILNNLDLSAQAAVNAINAEIDDSLTADLQAMMDEFDGKRTLLRVTAETINAGAAVINAAGGRFPELSIPTGLGVAFVLPIAAAAAIGTAAVLIAWGVTWINGVNDRLKSAQLLSSVTDPDKRASLAASMQASDAARAAATSPLASIANIVKWGAIGYGIYLLWQAFGGKDSLKHLTGAKA
jgi:hypothetical protein